MSEELSVQRSVDSMMWDRYKTEPSFRDHVLKELRLRLGEEIIKAVGEGWIVSSAVTVSEFDSIRNYSGDTAWMYRPPEPDESQRAWPPRRVFVMAVRMDRPIQTQDRFGVQILALTADARRPPDPIYDEWSRTPWAGDLWPVASE